MSENNTGHHPLGYCESCKKITEAKTLTLRHGSLVVRSENLKFKCLRCGKHARILPGTHQIEGDLYKFFQLQDTEYQREIVAMLGELVNSELPPDQLKSKINEKFPWMLPYLPRDIQSLATTVMAIFTVLNFFFDLMNREHLAHPTNELITQVTVMPEININLDKQSIQSDDHCSQVSGIFASEDIIAINATTIKPTEDTNPQNPDETNSTPLQ